MDLSGREEFAKDWDLVWACQAIKCTQQVDVMRYLINKSLHIRSIDEIIFVDVEDVILLDVVVHLLI